MEFRILGPIDVRSASGGVALGGNKSRAVLAVLLLNANRSVSAERLAVAIWGEDAPGSNVKTVQVHVSRLRKALGDPDVLTTTKAGYSLRVREGELDAERFEDLVEDARRAMADGQAESAAESLREALALWRGPALAELVHEPFAAAEITRLQEQRLAALELRIEADLAAGRHADVVGELQQLVVDNPLRERLAAQLMLALYRDGRHMAALEAYGTTRRALVEELGIGPGPELRERYEAIRRQDAALRAKPADPLPPSALNLSEPQPLVGRDEELGWLLARWESARGGTGAIVTLTGPPGVGKTRLLAEVARSIRGQGVTVLHATGDEPADALLEALRRARESTQPTLLMLDDADRAGEGVLGELARLGPRLADLAVLVVASTEAADTLTPVQPAGVLELGPLDAEAVREIAATADVPADWLLEASAGMPRRVHEAASRWARGEAARHVGALADPATTDRGELRTLEAELAGEIADAQGRRDRVDPDRREDMPVASPFKGLAPYDAVDARYFYGRERLVAELVARLVGAPLLAVVGPSGSGKSSVMRAGLLPALATGVLPGSETWQQILMRPGRLPLHELAAALADVDSDRRTVLAIDQFEETFTVCNDEDERAEFIAGLVRAALDPRRRYVIVIALRADCYGSCAAYPELAALLAKNTVMVGAMSRDELRCAIEGPCERARLSIEPELVDALVGDVGRAPGGLPLLSACLLELWQLRDGRRLHLASHAQTGGVYGAAARLAEDAFARLDEGQQAVGRGVLTRLVGTGEAGAVEPRRVALDDLDIARDEDAARVIALLTDRRVLTVGADSVELAHEALLREWPRMRCWIEEDRDGLHIERGLRWAVTEWERLGRDEDVLYRGTRLREVVEWRASRRPRLSESEREFVTASEVAGRLSAGKMPSIISLLRSGGLSLLRRSRTTAAACDPDGDGRGARDGTPVARTGRTRPSSSDILRSGGLALLRARPEAHGGAGEAGNTARRDPGSWQEVLRSGGFSLLRRPHG